MIQILLPVIIICAGAAALLLLGIARSPAVRRLLPSLALATILLALVLLIRQYGQTATAPELELTSLAWLTQFLTLTIGALLVLLAWRPDSYYTQADLPPGFTTLAGEFFALMLFSLAGIMLVSLARNLLLLALAIELVSFPTYALVAISRPHPAAREAGLKYFFLGALATAILFFALALLYGFTGSTDLAAIRAAIAANPHHLLALVFLLLIAGLSFKIAAVPMHFYAPDVYQGAAAPVTAFIAFAPKLAGFVALLLLVGTLGWPLVDPALPAGRLVALLLWGLAAATMTVGNTLALVQKNVKRILAYSSIAHSGYIMLALLAGRDRPLALTAILFYIAIYALATLGAFGVLSFFRLQKVTAAGVQQDEPQHLADLAGLGRRHPALAAALALFLFSLIGMPLTGGFIGKYYLFANLLADTSVPARLWLLLLALANAAAAAAYYLRIIAACYLSDSDFTPTLRPQPAPAYLSLALAALLTIILGVYPSLLTRLFLF